MPEGDTIFRTARTLAQALTDRRITRFRTTVAELVGQELVGRSVIRVESRGKNLLIHFDDGRVLYTHMRMTGSWHLYRLAESWRRPEHQANLALDTDRHTAVCFNAPVVELMSALALRRHRWLSRLGPDLLADRPDFAEMMRRIRDRPHDPLGVAVMRQEALSGIGNVYKSETLFLERLDPFATVDSLEPAGLQALLHRARDLMLHNLTGYPRITRPGGGSRYWVYGRASEPCLRCETPVSMRRQGDAGRSTYWCPSCQVGAAKSPMRNIGSKTSGTRQPP